MILQKAVATIVPMFQPVAGNSTQAAPFADYYFIFHVWPKTGGGLEHLNSTQIDFSTDWDSMEPVPGVGTQYNLKLFVAAHEFFHAWNVKRLRPLPLGPFDYTQMVHTPSLWISEGLTSYYGELALERAGLITPQQYLDSIGVLITKFEQKPGRSERSIEDTSWDTWFPRNGVIQQANNLLNTWYSYYDGGQIMGHILDFAIRENTQDQKSLDDWMRLLYSRYALPKPGFEPGDPIKAASEVAGADESESIYSLYFREGPDSLREILCVCRNCRREETPTPSKPWEGIETAKNDSDDRAKIRNIIPGSPAETAGFERDDVIFAVDSRAVDSSDSFTKEIAAHKPGDTVKITVLRLGEFKEFPVMLAANPYPTYTLKPMEHPTDQQKTIYNSWLGIKQ